MSASSFPNVKDIILPTFQNIASFISGINCEVYWFATISDNLYFLASDNIVTNDSVAKF
jgi:hypothetical protein